ncbi:hypothetical protein KP509_15G058400 [Ceratopteris richardii]|uniref:Xyloglucan endotransglucosylase/hydrolase n=1 Tax=Ceratopteris richardii TaxID=49495 RepID=A0A8T2T4Z5_CERRI|nr:hypothetical protein KP509_15G058400 [Ceratopteris richardii]
MKRNRHLIPSVWSRTLPEVGLVTLLAAAIVIWSANVALGEDMSALFALSSPGRSTFTTDNQEVLLGLNQEGGSGLSSYSQYLFGYFNMRVKMIPGNSAGTVTTFYFTSFGDAHDELDFEFLGNVTGQPIILQTNIYASGKGDREQRIFLWFDPTLDFHNYTILWNPQQVVFYVDGVPIRVYPNVEAATGVPYLKSQLMYAMGTIWDGDSWATEGGRVKIDWDNAPFIASYRDYFADACTDNDASTTCAMAKWWSQPQLQALDDSLIGQLDWVKKNYMVYDYCNDYARFNGTPPECAYTRPTSILYNTNSSLSSSAPSPTSSPFSVNPSSPGPSPVLSMSSRTLKYAQPIILLSTSLIILHISMQAGF